MAWLSVITGSMNSIYTAIIAMLFLAVIVLVIALVLYKRSFKYIVLVKDLVSGGALVALDTGKDIKKGGVYKFKFWKLRRETSSPQPHQISTTKDGRKFVMCAINHNGEITWITPQLLTEEERGIVYSESMDAVERESFIQEAEENAQRVKKTFHDWIVPVTSITALLVIVVCMMVFWGNIVGPSIQVNEKSIAALEKISAICFRDNQGPGDYLSDNQQTAQNIAGQSIIPLPGITS